MLSNKARSEIYSIVRNALLELGGTKPGKTFEFLAEACDAACVEVALAKVRGNQLRAAEILGINRNTLRRKIDRYEIDLDRTVRGLVSSKHSPTPSVKGGVEVPTLINPYPEQHLPKDAFA